MKRNRRKRVFSIICYIINIIIVFYPWIIVGNTKYNIVQLKRKIETIGIHTMIKRNGLIVDNPNFVGAMVKVQVVLYFCFILLCLGYIVCVVIGKNWRLNLVTFYASIGLMIVNITGYSIASLCTNTIQGTLFPIITVIITLIELLSSALPEKKNCKKIIVEEFQNRYKKYYLKIKNNEGYSALFYKILWKLFRSNWKNYVMVLLSGSLALGIFFCGFGMQKLFALNYRINKSVMGNDTQFLLKLYAPLELILLFTIILLLLYYVKCSTNNYEMLVTLGMEKKLSVYIRVIESIFGGIIIGIAGIVAGKLLLNIFVYVLEKWANLSMDIQSIGADCYIKALSITGVIYIFSCMFTRDIYGSFQMGNSVDKRDIQERMPKRFLKVLTAIGMVLCVSQLYRYSKIYNFESFYIIGVFLGGLLVLFRYMSAYLCIKRRKKISYLYKMIEENKMWNKSLTQTGYLYALTVVHLCVLFLFSFQIISIILVVKPQQLYPYDIVCIADDGDRSVFNKMAIDYKVNIEEYPMVRISNFDCTERLESFGEKTVQGQQIGISESTYHKLKEKLDQSYVPKPLGLSKDGKIFILFINRICL